VPRRQIYFSLAGLIALVTLADTSGGLIDLPMSFMLKNDLGFDATEVARFRLLVSLPFWLSILFGLARDASHEIGISDRRLTIVFGLLSAVCYFVFSYMPGTSGSLFVAMILATCGFQMVSSAQSGLTAAIGQHYNITGRISAIWNATISLATALAFCLGGLLSELLEQMPIETAVRIFFAVCALLSATLIAFGLVNPATVFSAVEPRSERKQSSFDIRTSLRRQRRAIPSLAIWFIWNFAPGSATPLQYHLQNRLGATDAQWGLWNAVFSASFLPTLALYGYLSTRVTFRTLLFCATLISAPQFMPLLFVHSMNEAFAAAVLIGMLGGLATAAYLDLIIRSCSPGVEATTLMLAGSLYFIATRTGDISGAYLYAWSGNFQICVAVMTALYCGIVFIVPSACNQLKSSNPESAPPSVD
jgi:MFS family permease